MERYNHSVGVKIVGEIMPDENNCVTLADETDEIGLKIARVTFYYGDNDKRLINHAMGPMRDCLDAAGVCDLWYENNDTCHLNGTARMGGDPRTSASAPIAGAGTFPICGFATDLCSLLSVV
jgi:hypothetical protein